MFHSLQNQWKHLEITTRSLKWFQMASISVKYESSGWVIVKRPHTANLFRVFLIRWFEISKRKAISNESIGMWKQSFIMTMPCVCVCGPQQRHWGVFIALSELILQLQTLGHCTFSYQLWIELKSHLSNKDVSGLPDSDLWLNMHENKAVSSQQRWMWSVILSYRNGNQHHHLLISYIDATPKAIVFWELQEWKPSLPGLSDSNMSSVKWMTTKQTDTLD